jgi:hypothetical protein
MKLLRPFRSAGGVRWLVSPYSEIATVSRDLTFEYVVIPPFPVGANYVIEWDSISAVGQNYLLSSGIQQYVAADFFLGYRVGDGGSTSSRILRPFRKSGSLNRLLEVVGRTGSPFGLLSLSWNLGGTVTREATLQWSIQAAGPGIGDPLGDPFSVAVNTVAASGAVTMSSPLSAVFREYTIQYQINGTIGSMVPSPATLAISSVGAAGSVAMSSTQLTAASDLTLQYSIANAATLSLATRWNVLGSAGASYLTSWSVGAFSLVNADLTLSYGIISVTGRSAALEYNVLMSVGVGYVFQYYILDQNAVASEYLPLWNILGSAQADLPIAWNSAGRQWADLSFLYRVGIRPAIDVTVVIPDNQPELYADADWIVATPVSGEIVATPVRL